MAKLHLKKQAYTVGALVAAGVPATVAQTLVVAEGATIERPLLSLTGRKRGQPTSFYVWGPDAAWLLTGDEL